MSLFDLDFKNSPYKIEKNEKDKILSRQLLALTKYHQEHCMEYQRILSAYGCQIDDAEHYQYLPYLPVGLFKRLSLSSIPEGTGGIKTVTSSGTTGQKVSRVALDGETRTLQQQALAAIGNDFIGKQRIPMLVIDSEDTIQNRNVFSARTAGILGFSLFAQKRCFALNRHMELDMEAVCEFLAQYGKERFLIFGFTFIVWKQFCLVLEARGVKLNLSNGILIHGGGWKKLEAVSVAKQEFKERLYRNLGIRQIHDYYGMAEQSGSIFMECEYGHMHCSDYSGILIRRASDFEICGVGERGIIQVLSVLPLSYPGHSILTEDEGVLLGEDNCPCGRKGAYFNVLGRVKNAEIRGCSDTYEEI